MDTEGKFAAGAEILSAKLRPLGFEFAITERGKGSGGPFAAGQFSQGDRSISLWYRFGLGGVSYRKGTVEASHLEFMEALQRKEQAQYPGFSDGNELSAFHRLLGDLEFCDSFLQGAGDEFSALIRVFRQKPKPKGFAALG
jgi:hypothetical protein